MLTVGSTFSGVGGIDLGLQRAGMRVLFQAESDPWCRRILAQHWPDIPCFDDVRTVSAQSLSARLEQPERVGVDLACGGFPCQDLSVAGRRAGLNGERSGLFFEFARIADELVRADGWIVIENVTGLLSSQGGRDFAVVVRTLGDIGFHDLAWRVLDSRYFGVPQRRRRIYVVGRRAVGRGARTVLLEPESGGGDFAPSRQTRARASLLAEGGAVQALDAKRGGVDDNEAQAGHLVAPAIIKRYAKGTDSDATDVLIAHTLRAEGFDASEDGTGRGTPLVANTLKGQRGRGGGGIGPEETLIDSTPTDANGVRAPTGLPRRVDDPRPDGPRYAAMGNAVTVNVAHWLGSRIVAYESGGLAA